jgi:hypothetical protein
MQRFLDPFGGRGGSVEAATEQFELALFLDARYVRQ